MDTKNLSIIRQCFASAVFTHKVQEVAAERQAKKVFLIKITNIIFVIVVLTMLLLQSYNQQNQLFTYIGAGITVAEIIFLIIQLTFGFEQQVVMHKNSALKYMNLRDNFKLLIVDIMNNDITSESLKVKRDLLQREHQTISDLAPQTGRVDYSQAQLRLNKRGVVSGEDFTWSDEEIDWFLPENLRLKNYEK